MEKGKGKCIVCGNDEFAVAPKVVLTLLSQSAEDRKDWKYFNDISAYACTHCGFIQLTSNLPKATDPTESPNDSGSRIGGSYE